MSFAQASGTTQPAAADSADVDAVQRNDEARKLLQEASRLFEANPPALTLSKGRLRALSLVDEVLHDPFAPNRPAVSQFRTMRVKNAIQQMRNTVVADNTILIWQIYNMGFVVRTKSATIGFDLVKMSHLPDFALDDGTAQALIDQCDVLLVSHVHADHADQWVANQFIAAGKPVLGPDSMWKGEPIHDRITHLRRDQSDQSLVVRGGAAKLTVNVLPGAQHMSDGVDVEDNVYVVTTPSGLRIAHTGDNNITSGLPSKRDKIPPVDVLIMKAEPGRITADAAIRAFAPKLVVPSHFDEIGHKKVSSRQSYQKGIELLSQSSAPFVVMTWGDCYRYIKQ